MADKLWFFLALGAAILWGVSYALSELVLKQISVVPLYWLYSLFSLVIMSFFIFSGKNNAYLDEIKKLDFSSPVLWPLVILIVVNLMANFMIFTSIVEKNASYTAAIEATYPLFTLIAAFFILKQVEMNWVTLFGCLMIVAGSGLIFLYSK